MIIVAIIVGILICGLIILELYFSKNNIGDSNKDLFTAVALIILMIIEIDLVFGIIENQTPSALDVYRGNTELEITSVNGTPIDTVVVFKKELKH